MHVYRLEIVLQDMLYFASRELGRTFTSEPYIHNYALSYALGWAHSSYHDTLQVPHYREDLQVLNDVGVYVTPAKPLEVAVLAHTFKLADTRYQVKMEKSNKNVPSYGRIRELAPESRFEAFVFSLQPRDFPAWIRLGKWMSKARVQAAELPYQKAEGAFVVHHPLNALDVRLEPQLYDLIAIPPVSLINNGRFDGQHYKVQLLDSKEARAFPQAMAYGI